MPNDAPFLVAFAGGLVATINPCGFAMAPAYLSFLLGLGDDREGGPGPSAAITRAVPVGLSVAAGFTAVFAVAGMVLAAAAQVATRAIPWVALGVGLVVIGLGVWVLTGHAIPARLPAPGGAPRHEGFAASFVFGLGYAAASLSCTLPVFFAVVVATVARADLSSALAVFGVYSLGAALPLLAVTIALAVGRNVLVRRVRALGRHVGRVSGVLLVISGMYVVFYWVTELSGLTNPTLVGLVRFVEGVSSALTRLIGEHPILWGAGLIALLIAAGSVAQASRLHRAHRLEDSPPAGDGAQPSD